MTSSGGPEERVRVLERLVAAETPVASVVREMALFEWASDEELITLERGHVLSVLERRLAGELSEADCILWADTVEMREDIRYEPGHEPAIAEFLFEATFRLPGNHN